MRRGCYFYRLLKMPHPPRIMQIKVTKRERKIGCAEAIGVADEQIWQVQLVRGVYACGR